MEQSQEENVTSPSTYDISDEYEERFLNENLLIVFSNLYSQFEQLCIDKSYLKK